MARFTDNPIMSLTAEAARYDLAESVGPNLRVGDLFDAGALAPEFAALELGYGSTAGDRPLRAAIAAAHDVDADDVTVTVGAMHALLMTALALCDDAAEVITTTPLFPPARAVLDAFGTRLQTLPLTFDGGYRLDLDALRERLSPRTRLVSLASPQNPSGVALSPQTLRDVVGLLAEHSPDAYLLVDETYREAVYGDDVTAPSALGAGARVVSCASLSKCHGAPGLRIGWLISGDAALRDALRVAKFNSVVSCSRVDETLALRVLQRRDVIVGARRRRLADGLQRTADWVRSQRTLIDWVRPDAGALCCVRLRPSAFDDAAVERFYRALAARQIRVADGRWFGDQARVFRLGFGWPPADCLDAALNGMTAALRQCAAAAV